MSKSFDLLKPAAAWLLLSLAPAYAQEPSLAQMAGQMIVAKVPVTFCFTVNWNGPDGGVAAVFESYRTSVASALREAALVAGG